MGIKVTLLAFPNDRKELVFAEFPTSEVLSDAVNAEAATEFVDLVANLESDDVSEFEADYEAAGQLVLDSHLEGDRIGIVVFEPIAIY